MTGAHYPFTIPDRAVLYLYVHRDDPPEMRTAPWVLDALGALSRRESLTRVMSMIDPGLYVRSEMRTFTRKENYRRCACYTLTDTGLALGRRLVHLAELQGMTPDQVIASRFRDRNNRIIAGGEMVACSAQQ